MISEWNIQGRSPACQACHRRFLAGETYHTLLFDERGGYLRQDVCGPCWAGQYSQGAVDRKGFVSHWRGLFEVPEAAPEPIRKDTAESLLRQLVERGDPQYLPATYILAVMLERKRILKVKGQSEREGRRVFHYEHPRSGDLFTVVDPQLQLDQLEAVQRSVAALLEHGLAPTAASTPAAVAPASAVSAEIPGDAPRDTTPVTSEMPAAAAVSTGLG